MNNKGFAITGIIYGLMVLFVFILSSFLAVVVGKNKRSEELTKSVYDSIMVDVKNVHSFNSALSKVEKFDKDSLTYVTSERAKYVFYNDDETVCGEVYLPKGIEVKVKSDGTGLEYTVNGSSTSFGNNCSYSMGSETEEPEEPEDPTTSCEADVDSGTPNSPDLVDGLIPVMYDESKNKWVVADKSNTNETYKWYDYDNKQWANAVLVTKDKRDGLSKDDDGSYKMGQIIGDSATDEVLAFYVWIPRYKYKVWNISKQAGLESLYAYKAYSEGIDIVFEEGTTATGTIKCSYNYNADPDNGGIDLSTTTAETCTGSNGDYYTHPAFCLGETTNGVCSGDTLRGFWIGKFELSSSDPQTGNSYGGDISTSLTPRVLPNVTSWRNNYLANFNTVIQNMTKSSNIYGLSASTTSSHMLTNMEWGAVAYLTNSKYGRCSVDASCNTICKEVALNAYGEDEYLTTMTGCGSISSGSTSYGTTCNAYDTTLGMSASTTGNITGVYDMSGGAYEYVMGNTSMVTTKYTFYPSGSNFLNSWYTSNTSKYLTTYANYTISSASSAHNQESYNRGRLGDATAEIVFFVGGHNNWYDDYAFFPIVDYAWFIRGGGFYGKSSAGVFDFGDASGGNDIGCSARPVLAALDVA